MTISRCEENSTQANPNPGQIIKAGKGVNASRTFMTGAISGIASGTLLQPFDVIRTHLQAPGQSTKIGMVGMATKIVNEDGWRGLWRGTGPTCIRVGLGAGIYFAILDGVMRSMKKVDMWKRKRWNLTGSLADDKEGHGNDQPLPPELVFCAGFITRAVSAVAVCPVTVLKTRMEYSSASGEVFGGTLGGLASIFQKEGIRGLFRGAGPTIARDAPFSGLYLVLYAKLRALANEKLAPIGAPVSVSTLMAGALAGALATVMTHPPDVIRTQMQLRAASAGGGRIWHTSRAIWRAHGVGGFFRGVLPRVLKRSLHQAVAWTIFEEFSRALSGKTVWDKQNR